MSYRLPDVHQFLVKDHYRQIEVAIPQPWLEDASFDLYKWYVQYLCQLDQTSRINVATDPKRWLELTLIMAELLAAPWVDNTPSLDMNGIQVDRNEYPALQHNAVRIKGQHRIIPKHIVVKVTINQHPAQALLDSGSLGDFISSTLADQLKLQRQTLDTPLALQLVVQGLRSEVNATTSAQLKYQGIDEQCTFDIINLSSYDLILGTPWMYQHQICLGFNSSHIIVGSDEALLIAEGAD